MVASLLVPFQVDELLAVADFGSAGRRDDAMHEDLR